MSEASAPKQQSLQLHVEAVWGLLQQQAQQANFAELLLNSFAPQQANASGFAERCSVLIQQLETGDRLGLGFRLVEGCFL